MRAKKKMVQIKAIKTASVNVVVSCAGGGGKPTNPDIAYSPTVTYGGGDGATGTEGGGNEGEGGGIGGSPRGGYGKKGAQGCPGTVPPRSGTGHY